MMIRFNLPTNYAASILKSAFLVMVQISLLIFPALAFAISTVNLTLDEGDAAEFGQVPGGFTVTRTDDGNIAQGFNVRVVVTGSATWDADYSRPGLAWAGVDANSFNVHIAANTLSTTITLTPTLDNLIEDDESIGIQLKDIGVAYTATVENKIEMIIADFREVIFKDSFEDIEP